MVLGISYPLEIDNGNLKISSNQKLVSEQILSWFETYKNERVQPDYGIPDMVGTGQNIENLIAVIRTDLLKEFQNLRFSISGSFEDDGFFNLEVTYKNLEFEDVISIRIEN